MSSTANGSNVVGSYNAMMSAGNKGQNKIKYELRYALIAGRVLYYFF